MCACYSQLYQQYWQFVSVFLVLFFLLVIRITTYWNFWYFAAPARLPSFHTCVGANEERLTPKWYNEHGNNFLVHCSMLSTKQHFVSILYPNWFLYAVAPVGFVHRILSPKYILSDCFNHLFYVDMCYSGTLASFLAIGNIFCAKNLNFLHL